MKLRGILCPKKPFFLPTIQIEKYATKNCRHFSRIRQYSIESSKELQFFEYSRVIDKTPWQINNIKQNIFFNFGDE
jgi:hypothetical protein